VALQYPGAVAAPVILEGGRLCIAPPRPDLSWEMVKGGDAPHALREGDWVVLRPVPLSSRGDEPGEDPGAGPECPPEPFSLPLPRTLLN